MNGWDVAYRVLERCRGCYSLPNLWREVLRMDPMPLAGQFCRSREEALGAERYPLTWIECSLCGLVQILQDVDDRVLFTEYNYASSTVPGLVRHFEEYAAFLGERYRGRSVRLLELGCNDGVLLNRLPADWTLVGVDPSDVAGRAATGTCYEMVQVAFTAAAARNISGAGQFDVVTGSNCLAHISDLLDVFRGVEYLLRPGGEFIVEVHDLAATVDTAQWDTIYHEHKAEWSEESLAACLAPLGFEPTFLMRLPLHGGLLRAGFRKVGIVPPPHPLHRHSFELLKSTYEGRRGTETYQIVAQALARGDSVSAYGASGRANVWLNQLPELKLSYIVDDSPLRSGKWLPCIALPVVAARHFIERPTDVCVVTAWNFAADIQAKFPSYGAGGGRWLQSLGARVTT